MKGEPRYQKLLVEHYSPMLFTVARRYASKIEDAQDILQDALVKILKAMQSNYREEGRLESWMRTVVITTALNNLDRSYNRKEVQQEPPQGDLSCPPDAYSHLGTEELLKLIASLPDGYRQVFNLAVIDQLPHAEIAELLSISESTSRSQLLRARRLLQQMILKLEKIKI